MENFEEGQYYHIYNRGVDSAKTFKNEENYLKFLESLAFYLQPVMKIYGYCLLPNHFHLLARVRTELEQNILYDRYKKKESSWIPYGVKYPTFKPLKASRQLGHLFNSYTKYFNKLNHRTGNLFSRTVKRKRIGNHDYLVHLICYIHRNPIHHGYVNSYEDYPFSTYTKLLNNHPSILAKEEVLEWFGGQENFIEAHKEMILQIDPEALFDEQDLSAHRDSDT